MTLGQIRGQDRVVNTLRRAIHSSRVAHCYLFEGPSGTGRRTTATALIQSLFCSSPNDGSGCGVCSSCKKLASGNHPDLHFLEPLPDKRDISIEQIRELQQVLSLRPYEATRKACIIEPAERMSIGASNAMLKTLEEPPGNALMILLSSQADQLLATIRSRCQHLRFAPLDEKTVADLLVKGGVDPELAKSVAPLAEGSIDRAVQLSGEPDAETRSELLGILSQANSKQIASIFDPAEQLSGSREDTIANLEIIISLLRDMMMILSDNPDAVINRGAIKELKKEAIAISHETCMEALALALETLQAVKRNANSKLALEHFLLGYASLKCNQGYKEI